MRPEYPTKDGAGNTIIASEMGSTGPVVEAAGGFTAIGVSTTIIVPAGTATPANVHMTLWGAFVGTVALEKSYDAGGTWNAVITDTGADDQIYIETEQGVQFRMHCTAYTSGTASYRIAIK